MSNQYRAFYGSDGNISISGAAGSGNNEIYNAFAGSIIQVLSAGPITGTTMYSRAAGGVIIQANGRMIGTTAVRTGFPLTGFAIPANSNASYDISSLGLGSQSYARIISVVISGVANNPIYEANVATGTETISLRNPTASAYTFSEGNLNVWVIEQ